MDNFRGQLPLLRDHLERIDIDDYSKTFIAFLEDDDFIQIYSEWLFNNKTKDEVRQTGFIFETLSQRFVRLIQPSTELDQQIQETIMFLCLSPNNHMMWNSERSNPDDIGTYSKDGIVYIDKIYESKISLKALDRSKEQRIESMITVTLLVNALNGSDKKITTHAGKRLIRHSRNHLDNFPTPHLKLSPDFKYVYVLPSDQVHLPDPYAPIEFDTINIPLSADGIERFRETVISFYGQYFGK